MTAVVLDANAVVADLRLRSAAMRVLLRRSRDGLDTVVISTVAFAEIVSTYERAYRDSITDLKKGARQLERLRNDLADQSLLGDIEELEQPDNYEVWLRDELVEHEVEVRNPPGDAMAELVRRATARLLPFDSKGSGFRDALVWLTLKDYLITNHPTGELAFISNDRKAFWKDDGFHPALAQELTAAGIPGSQVTIYDSVTRFVRSRIADDPEVHNQVVDVVDTDFAQLMTNLEVLLTGQVLDIFNGYGEGVVVGFAGGADSHLAVDHVGSTDIEDDYLVTMALNTSLVVEVDGYDPVGDHYLIGNWTIHRIVAVSGIWQRDLHILGNLTIAAIEDLHPAEGYVM